jgi:DNA-binding transcriptional LysR family regulator
MEALEANGLPPGRLNVVAEMGSTEAVRQGIKAGIGVSILSAHAVGDDLKHNTLTIIPLKETRIVRPFYLARRKNRELSPLCSTFLDYLRSQPAEPPTNGG